MADDQDDSCDGGRLELQEEEEEEEGKASLRVAAIFISARKRRFVRIGLL